MSQREASGSASDRHLRVAQPDTAAVHVRDSCFGRDVSSAPKAAEGLSCLTVRCTFGIENVSLPRRRSPCGSSTQNTAWETGRRALFRSRLACETRSFPVPSAATNGEDRPFVCISGVSLPQLRVPT